MVKTLGGIKMFILEAEKVLGESWDVYSSGGGCYHALKDYTSLEGKQVGIQLHWSGEAHMYHNDNKELITIKSLEEDDFWDNYIILAWTTDDEKVSVENDFLGAFSEETQKEIVKAMVNFEKCYDNYMY